MGTGDHGGIPAFFHPAVAEWFQATFARPTRAQTLGWPAIARGESTLLVAPTGTGKTLAAFLWAIERVMFVPPPAATRRCRVLYVSPLKALAVDVERNLRVPLDGIARAAAARAEPVTTPAVAIRTGDTPREARARFLREPADILITTPESLFLLLTSRAREVMRAVETVIVDEIHALVSTKRGAHLALSLERLEWLAGRPLQRIGLSATVRPFEEVAAFLGGTLTVPPTSGVRRTPVRRPPTRSAGRAERAAAGDSGPAPAAQARPADERLSRHRAVTVIDARAPKTISLSIEMPARESRWPAADPQAAPAPASGPPSAWTGIHPRLLDLV